MKLIEELSDKIEEEIEDAESYAKLALEQKDTNKALADVFNKLSGEELGHMTMLHNEVVKIIENYKKTNGEPPANMMDRYEYMNRRHMKDVARVRLLQAMYKET